MIVSAWSFTRRVPGAMQHHKRVYALMALRPGYDTAFFIAGVPTNCRYFSIKVVAARKRIANARGVNSGIPDFLNVFQRWNS